MLLLILLERNHVKFVLFWHIMELICSVTVFALYDLAMTFCGLALYGLIWPYLAIFDLILLFCMVFHIHVICNFQSCLGYMSILFSRDSSLNCSHFNFISFKLYLNTLDGSKSAFVSGLGGHFFDVFGNSWDSVKLITQSMTIKK